MDVLWFRLPRLGGDPEGAVGRVSPSNLLIMIDRGDYFQIGLVIKKGSAATLRDQGIEAFRERLTQRRAMAGRSGRATQLFRRHQAAQRGAQPAAALVSRRSAVHRRCCSCHVTCRWRGNQSRRAGCGCHRPDRLLSRCDPSRWSRPTSVKVQRRRWAPTVLTQAFQRVAHRFVVATTIADEEADRRPTSAPFPLRLMQRFPLLQAIPGYFVGIGLLPEHAPDFARARATALAVVAARESARGDEAPYVRGDRVAPDAIALLLSSQHPRSSSDVRPVHDCPQTLEHFMIIARGYLAGEDRATDRCPARGQWCVGLVADMPSPSPDHRWQPVRVEHLVEVGLLAGGGPVCQRER